VFLPRGIGRGKQEDAKQGHGGMVIVAYRSKPGHYSALAALVVEHVPRLRRWGLATDRPHPESADTFAPVDKGEVGESVTHLAGPIHTT
jgi:hypothetical protein